jgi:hypothetical protein
VVRADTYVLTNGDRITGKTVIKGASSFGVQTPYGRLTIPLSAVERILHDNGHEEVITHTTPVVPSSTAPVHLVLVVTGSTFWYAWDGPKGGALDPTLRLQVSLDEDVIATYIDAHLDPQELPGATVNSFSFAPEDVSTAAGSRVQVLAPETRPGRIALRIGLPAERAGKHRLRFAYQINGASEAEPAWRDVVETSVDVTLHTDRSTFVGLHQDRGQMAFSGFLHKKMKGTETFGIEARAE